MTRGSGASLWVGITLVVIGIIFLTENWSSYAKGVLDRPFLDPWWLISRYWPVILILVGARKLYLHYTWTEVPPIAESERVSGTSGAGSDRSNGDA